jgi:hypothetical protein
MTLNYILIAFFIIGFIVAFGQLIFTGVLPVAFMKLLSGTGALFRIFDAADFFSGRAVKWVSEIRLDIIK